MPAFKNVSSNPRNFIRFYVNNYVFYFCLRHFLFENWEKHLVKSQPCLQGTYQTHNVGFSFHFIEFIFVKWAGNFKTKLLTQNFLVWHLSRSGYSNRPPHKLFFQSRNLSRIISFRSHKWPLRKKKNRK